MSEINAAILERLEKVVDNLQENSVKMGELLAVHNEKLDKQDRIDAVLFEKVESSHREVNRRSDEIKKGCERDIRKVDDRLRLMEKKMWSIFGGLNVFIGTWPHKWNPNPRMCSRRTVEMGRTL